MPSSLRKRLPNGHEGSICQYIPVPGMLGRWLGQVGAGMKSPCPREGLRLPISMLGYRFETADVEVPTPILAVNRATGSFGL